MLLHFALLAVLVATTASAIDAKPPTADWKEAHRTADLVIFTQDDPTTGTRKLTAITDLPQPPETVFQVVTDFAHYTQFMPYIKECRILDQQGDDSLTCYQLISPPLVSERDYIIQVNLTRGPANNGIWKSEWTAKAKAQPERSGIVRIKLNTGSWTLTPNTQGTRVTYFLHTSPGGSIPSMIANKSNTVAIPDLFKAIKERSAWQQAQ
jgi:ribosome-associated toxin RatA of RatAB toxin-antitoxin module